MTNALDLLGGGSVTDLQVDLILQLATRYPWIMTALLLVGGLRLLIKPAIALAHQVAEASGAPKNKQLLERIESSPTFRAFLFIVDWLASIKIRR